MKKATALIMAVVILIFGIGAIKMSERNFYVICEDNCKFEGMTKEQIIAAIAEATGNAVTNIDDAFITKIKEQNKNIPLQFWIGTQAEYNALAVKDPNTFYITSDETELADIEQMATETATEVATEKVNEIYERRGTRLASGVKVGSVVNEIGEYKLVYVASPAASGICYVRETKYDEDDVYELLGVCTPPAANGFGSLRVYIKKSDNTVIDIKFCRVVGFSDSGGYIYAEGLAQIAFIEGIL